MDIDKKYMSIAFEEANAAFDEMEVPIGCVFVKNNDVIARGHNYTNASGNGTMHAEMMAIMHTLKANNNDVTIFHGSILYVTIEPCIMCASAVSQVGVERVVFGASNDRFGGCGSVISVNDQLGFPFDHHCFDVTRGMMKDESVILLQRFYNRENDHAPITKRRKKSYYFC